MTLSKESGALLAIILLVTIALTHLVHSSHDGKCLEHFFFRTLQLKQTWVANVCGSFIVVEYHKGC